MPAHPAFMQVLCPHYFAECLIYLSIAIIAAPSAQLVNRTVFCAMIFVVVNLGVTADGTKTWYEQKFGQENVASRRRMVPIIF